MAGAYKYESISVGATAVGLTQANIDLSRSLTRNKSAIITVEDEMIRFRVDNIDPTASEGHIALIGDTIHLDEHSVPTFIAISAGSGTSKLKVSYGI